MDIIFSESSGLQDSVYGKAQAPIRFFMQKRAEAFEADSPLKKLFKFGTSNSYADMMTTMTAMGDFEPVPENGSYPMNSMQEGYQKTLVYREWESRFVISRTIIEDSKLMDLTSRPAQFLTAYERTRERFGAHMYAAAMTGKKDFKLGEFTFNCQTADDSNLFATNHKAKIAGAAQSNSFNNAFSLDALSYVEEKMHLFKDDNGNICNIAPDTILIPENAALKDKVFAAIGSDKNPMDATNAYNYQYGRWNVIIWPYLNQFLTGSELPWVVLDSKYIQEANAMIWNDRVALSMDSFEDKDHNCNVWQGRSRFSAMPFDWRFAACGGMSGGTDVTGK